MSLLVITPVYAQTVLITVLEKGTAEPVANANIVVMETEEYVVTDENGQAEIPMGEADQALKILALGYETLVTPFSPVDGKITCYLEPVSVEAAGVEVVAERLPEKVSKFSITAEELAHAPGSQGDPVIAVQSLPGVVAAEDGSGQVYMRGSDIYDNKTFVNRVPIGYLYHFGGLRSTINPQLISDLNVFLGGFPVSYGDALGGVFDVQLREPRTDRRRYHFDISTIEANFIVEGGAGDQNADGYYFAARRSYIDLIFSPSDFTEFAADDDKSEEETNQFISVPEYFDIQGLYRHPLHNGYLDYYYFSAGDKLAFENREGVKSDPQIAGDTITEQNYHTLGMSWKAQLDAQWKVDMPLAFIYEKTNLQLGSDDAGNPFYADSKQQSLTWLPQLTFQSNERNQYMFGLDLSLYKIPLDLYISRPPLEEDVYFNITDQNKYRVNDTIYAREIDPYFQYRRHWSEQWTSILGLRYSYIEGSGNISVQEFSPRLSMEYQYTPATLLFAIWGRFVQLPHGFQLLDGFGNPELEYTEAEHRIVGIEHQIDKLWSVKVEGYQKPMENLVVSIDNQTPPDNYDNLGEGDAYGVDIYVKRERKNGVMGWVSYSYSHAERFNPLKPADGDREFSGDQPHSLTLVWSQPFRDGPFDWMQDWKRWNWGIKFQAHSGTPYTELLGRHLEDPADPDSRYIPDFGRHNARRTSPYVRLDLRLERDFLSNTAKMKFYVDILNVTNHKNVVGYDYGAEYEKINNPDEVTGLPFFPYIGFEMDF
ncbi:MAG: TonB-dependent receptor [Gammaproteobacteria bacterium]